MQASTSILDRMINSIMYSLRRSTWTSSTFGPLYREGKSITHAIYSFDLRHTLPVIVLVCVDQASLGVISTMGRSHGTSKIPPSLEPLFHAMADEALGTLSVLAVSPSGLVRMRHDVFSPGKVRVRRDFSIADVRGLVQVRVPRHHHVMVSPVPSAVLAVALR